MRRTRDKPIKTAAPGGVKPPRNFDRATQFDSDRLAHFPSHDIEKADAAAPKFDNG